MQISSVLTFFFKKDILVSRIVCNIANKFLSRRGSQIEVWHANVISRLVCHACIFIVEYNSRISSWEISRAVRGVRLCYDVWWLAVHSRVNLVAEINEIVTVCENKIAWNYWWWHAIESSIAIVMNIFTTAWINWKYHSKSALHRWNIIGKQLRWRHDCAPTAWRLYTSSHYKFTWILAGSSPSGQAIGSF